jgi:hypothetical protein
MGRIIPCIMENKKCLKPPTSMFFSPVLHLSKIAPLRIISRIECYHSRSAQHMTYLDAKDPAYMTAR